MISSLNFARYFYHNFLYFFQAIQWIFVQSCRKFYDELNDIIS